jgi:hypothetical protein
MVWSEFVLEGPPEGQEQRAVENSGVGGDSRFSSALPVPNDKRSCSVGKSSGDDRRFRGSEER